MHVEALDPAALKQRRRDLEELRRLRARRSYRDFISCIDVPGAPVDEEDPECEVFYPERVVPVAHHLLLINVLQALADGKLSRAMFFLPPGAAKSLYSSVAFPPWFMGRKPRQNVLLCTYEQGLARLNGRRARQIVRSDEYQEIFGTSLSKETSAADEWELLNESGFLGRGILAGITGRRCDGGIIDDPVRNQQDADSEPISDRTWEEYNSSFDTRLKPNAWRLILQTRWHPNDLSGRLLPEGYDGRTGLVRCRDDYDWYVVCLPAICERRDDPLGRKPGDILWPEWFKREAFEKIKNNPARARDWASLYQQRPSIEGGSYFKDEWFKLYEERDLPEHLRFYGASDYAVTDKGGDYTVHVVFGVDAAGVIWIVDFWIEQKTTDVSTDAFLDLVAKWSPLYWATDRDQIVNSIGPFVTRRMRERSIYCAMEHLPMGRADKQMRARSFQARMAQGMVRFPARHPHMEYVRRQMLQFGGGSINDDVVDALGLAGRLLDLIVDATEPEEAVANHLDDYVSLTPDAASSKDWMLR